MSLALALAALAFNGQSQSVPYSDLAGPAFYIPGDAHCCVSAKDVVTLWWNGSTFEETSWRVELTDYGRRVGKTLGQQ